MKLAERAQLATTPGSNITHTGTHNTHIAHNTHKQVYSRIKEAMELAEEARLERDAALAAADGRCDKGLAGIFVCSRWRAGQGLKACRCNLV